MSGLLKKIGKVFKKVIKVVRKVALPALAIGAVVLTGGAALGALPALSTTIGSLGLSAGVTSALTTAAQGATMGFLGSAVTGGDPLKGATTGFITGGILGGASAALGGATGAGGPLSAAGDAAANADLVPVADIANGTGAAVGSGAQPITGMGSSLVGTASKAGGIGGFIERNPVIAGNVISGLGQGMTARAQAKEEERRRREVRDSYEGTDGLWLDGQNYSGMGQAQAPVASAPIDRFNGRYVFDGKTIKKVQV